MKVVQLSQQEARIVACNAGLGRGLLYGSDAPGQLEKVFDQTSWIQIDTISVVERAHHHSLWSRFRKYQPQDLSRLESPDDPSRRRIIEYWAHAAAYIPIADLRFSLPRMQRIRRDGHEWFQTNAKVVDDVRNRIREEGPFLARDFSESKAAPGGWWNWKPAKIALEHLFHAGELLVKTRIGFQKVFDLAERVVPEISSLTMPDDAEMAEWYLNRAETELGIFQEKDITYLRKDGTKAVRKELDARLETGRLIRCALPDGSTWFVKASEMSEPHANGSTSQLQKSFKPGIRILSPFDPFVINRARIQRLFDFDFTIECYVPEAKRRFGYFALPLLYIDEKGIPFMVGKVDLKAERNTGTLLIKRLAWEPPFAERTRGSGLPGPNLLSKELTSALKSFAAFNKCTTTVKQVSDSSFLFPLEKQR